MLLLKNIAQVVTMAGGPAPRIGAALSDIGIIENGAILVRAERIVWVGPTRELPVREPGVRYHTVDCIGLGVVALPGFVDAHTHPVFAGTRADEYEMRCRGVSYAEIAASGGGILASVRQVRAASADKLAASVERNLRPFLAHGTTTIEAKSGYGLSLEGELKCLRVLARARRSGRLEVVTTFLGAHAVPDEYAGDREGYIRLLVEEMIPLVAQERLAEHCDVFCDDGYFTVDEARHILAAARRAGLGVRIHADELSRTGGARLAAELGALSADHLEWIDDEDISALARAGTVATLLPGTAFNLGLSRYPPARKLIEGGVAVALASDFNPGSCFTQNMQLILSIACTQMKMSPAEALAAATINGACSLGLSQRVGSIEVDKQADVVLMGVPDYREIPYFFGINHCVLAVKKGNIVVNRLEAM